MKKTHLHYKRYGSGEEVYLGIPGFGATHVKSFSNMIARLPEHVTFYGMDPPGLGESPGPLSWSWAQVTDHMLEVLRAISEEHGGPITLVGACSGAFHAMEMSLRAPQHIKELVLLEPFGYTPWFLRAFLTPGVGYGVLHSMFGTELGRNTISKGLALRGITGEYNPIASFANVRPRDVHTYLRLYRALERQGPDYFAGISMPKRLFHGTKTFAAVKESVAIWSPRWKDLEIITIEDVGHQLTQEAPDLVNEYLFGAPRAQAAPRHEEHDAPETRDEETRSAM